jgi:hypothetical protein
LILGIEFRALHMLSRCSTIEIYLPTPNLLSVSKFTFSGKTYHIERLN